MPAAVHAAPRRPTRSRALRRALTIALASAVLAGLTPASVLAADTTRPKVTVTAPTAGSTISGRVTLKASASDNNHVARVKWYVDGNLVGLDRSRPWSETWNSGSVPAGSHKIVARARDRAGNWGRSAAVWFTTKSGTTGTGGWTLVQRDDFDGTSVNTTRWSVYGPRIPGHNGNGVRASSAVTVGNGLLTITARMINGTLVSGGLSNKLNRTYGKFEFRVRTDPDPSMATSGVVLTWPQSQNWPVDGENDIYETTLEPDRIPVKSFIHYGSDNRQLWFHHTGVDGTQWHVFAMEWTASSIKIYRDGRLAWTVTDRAIIPDVAHHLSMQLDAFKKSMSGTVRMQVDWVKIYKPS